MKNSEIHLGSFCFEPDTGALRNAFGTKVSLRYQATEVLRELAKYPNDVVVRDLLVRQIWQDRQGAEEGLVQCIAEIRRALQDSDKSIVETIPRKGYRLVAEIPDEATGKSVPRFWQAAVGATLLGVAALGIWWMSRSPEQVTKPVVTVLPFESLGDEDASYPLIDAVSDSIISSLARYPEFAVISKQSSVRFRGSTEGIEEIGQALGADYILQGTQLLQDRTLRLSVQLVDAHDSTLQMVDGIETPLEDMFDVNETIAFRVANTVSGVLVDLHAKEGRRPWSAPPEWSGLSVSA